MFEKLKIMFPFFGNEGKKKKSSKGLLSFDLFYQLSYMSTIAASGVPRDQIFERSAELKCSSAEYFKRVELARKRLKYDYARACRAVGEPVKEEEIKGLLLRFSSSLISGEPESEFLTREAETRAEDFQNEYGRALEALKMWTDAYVSLILSAVLVIVIGIVSTMIWKIETSLIIAMAFIAICVTVVGIWLIWVVSPKEKVLLSWPGSKGQKTTSKWFKPMLVAGILVAVFFLVSGLNLGYGLLIIAAIVYPLGHIMSKDDKRVAKLDDEIGTFLHSLGGVCNALGTTVNAALGRLDLNSINFLRTGVKNLHTRLTAGIKPRLSWSKFVDETGSELSNRSVGMFYDAIEVGGSAGMAGQHASLYANRLALLRARRRTVAQPFRWLVTVMHAAVIVILVFITEVIMSFGNMISQAQENLPNMAGSRVTSISALNSFNLSGLEMMSHLVIPLVIIFTIANSIVPALAEGGSRYKILSNLGMMSAISGICLLVLPKVAGQLFTSVSQL
jgi:archaeal flagellar protein FlaJ